MDSVAIYRIIRTGVINFWRNIWLSATASLIMVVTLTVLTSLLLVFDMTNFAISNVQQRVDISIYFRPQVTEKQILAIGDKLKALPEVAAVEYVSSRDALDIFRQKHVNEPEVLEALNQVGENPLPATLQVKARQLTQYQKINEYLKSPEYSIFISSANYEDNRNVIERLTTILDFVKKAGIVLAIFFSAVALLVVFNTIRLTIYNRREEVEIMKLVGATNWFIRWPFIVESIMYGVVGTIITILLTTPVFNFLVPKVNSYIGLAQDSQTFMTLSQGRLYLVQLATALLLGIISSLVAIRKYLKV
jgi:cell division transport system permease protein